MIDLTDPTQIVRDPTKFLHSIDVDGDRAFFFPTDPTILREASFIDGRTAIATGEMEQRPLSAIIDADLQVPTRDRFLFNCSFCGSTLLARLLDVPGRSLVLKEPRCLTDIAGWKVLNRREGLSIAQLRPALRLARAALRRRYAPKEKVIVKVASQGNVLIDTLTRDSPGMRPIFMTISPIGFLLAVFRGGPGRMQYAARIAWSMAADEADGDELLKEAVRAGADPERKAANLAVLAHHLQVRAFRRAVHAGGWNDAHVIDFEELASAPRETAMRAVAALDMAIGEEDIDRNVARFAGRYSKQPDLAFSIERERAGHRAAATQHRLVFADALAWGEKTLGIQQATAT